MQIDLSYFTVNKHQILLLSDEQTCQEFMEWYQENGEYIRLPWGDIVYSLECFVLDKEEFELQEEVFTECTLAIQNLIYNLKQLQLKDNPESKADLVFEP